MALTVLTWLWNQEGGRTRFGATHVNIWAAMVRRHCTLDIELACVTDMPEGIDPSIRIIEPPGFYDDLKTSRWNGGRPSCYRRLAMFAPDAGRIFGDRFCSMDLDLVISGNIDSILARDEEIVLCGPSQAGSRWLYNGSLIMLDAGARPQVFEDFSPEAAEIASTQFVGSDQAWLAYSLGDGEAVWNRLDGVVRWGSEDAGPMMFFPGNVKPWQALGDPMVAEHYRLEPGARVIVLCHGRSLWDDAKAALKRERFDYVVAMPNAARRFPGKVDLIASNLVEARQMAAMLGCASPVVCGA